MIFETRRLNVFCGLFSHSTQGPQDTTVGARLCRQESGMQYMIRRFGEIVLMGLWLGSGS